MCGFMLKRELGGPAAGVTKQLAKVQQRRPPPQETQGQFPGLESWSSTGLGTWHLNSAKPFFDCPPVANAITATTMGIPHGSATESVGPAQFSCSAAGFPNENRCQQANSFAGVSRLLWSLSSRVVLYRRRGVVHSQLLEAKNKIRGSDFILSDETKSPQKWERTAAENWNSPALSIQMLGGFLCWLRESLCSKIWSRFMSVISQAYMQENTGSLVRTLADGNVKWKLPAYRLVELPQPAAAAQ